MNMQRTLFGSIDYKIAIGLIILLAFYAANLGSYETLPAIPETGRQILQNEMGSDAVGPPTEVRENPNTIRPNNSDFNNIGGE